jgi:hypothetical protein
MSQSRVDMYAWVLQAGCRCVEGEQFWTSCPPAQEAGLSCGVVSPVGTEVGLRSHGGGLWEEELGSPLLCLSLSKRLNLLWLEPQLM